MANLSDYIVDPSYKVILAGMKGVGKSTLLRILDTKAYSDFDQQSLLISLSKGESSRGRTKLKLQTTCHNRPVSVSIVQLSIEFTDYR